MTSKNYRAPLLHYIKLCASSHFPRLIQTGVTVRKRSIRVKIGDFFVPCDREIWWMTLKNNWASLLCYIKLGASFQSDWWIQTGITVRKHSIRVKIGYLLSCVTLKFDGWHWKTIGHLFYIASRFMHHFIAISEFEVKCDLKIRQMTLKNNRAPLQCYFKFCALFRSHWWIQTGVTVLKHLIWVKINDFFSHVTLKFDRWLWKTRGHLS